MQDAFAIAGERKGFKSNVQTVYVPNKRHHWIITSNVTKIQLTKMALL